MMFMYEVKKTDTIQSICESAGISHPGALLTANRLLHNDLSWVFGAFKAGRVKSLFIYIPIMATESDLREISKRK